MKLGRNLLAGLTNSVWSALISLAVVPLYLKYLGIEAYGLIGFFATTQALLQLLDMGLTPTINREVARCSASGNMREARNLLHTLAVVYWVTAVVIALLIMLFAPLIASRWLQSSHISNGTLTSALMLMGLVIACRWPTGVYQGALMGMQRLAVSSKVNIALNTLASLGAVAVLAWVAPTIQAFFIWQAAAALLGAATMRHAAWNVIGREGAVRFDVGGLKRIWRFSVGMSGVAISGIVLMQLDKVLLSRMLSLEDFGRYMLATFVSSGLLVILTPVFNVIYPRLSSLVVTGDTVEMIALYRSGTRFLSTVLFPIVVVAAAFSTDIIYAWTRNLDLATTTAPIASLLLLGTGVNGVMIFPYALQLAYGRTKLSLAIIISLIAIYMPLTIYLVLSFGAIGGALAWLSLNLLYLVYGAWMTHRFLLKGIGPAWLGRDVVAPLALSLTTVLTGWQLGHVEGAYLANLFLGGALVLFAMSANIFLFQRQSLKKLWQQYQAT